VTVVVDVLDPVNSRSFAFTASMAEFSSLNLPQEWFLPP
jgi:hypothetical protein